MKNASSKIYSLDHQKIFDNGNTNFQAEHPFMDRLSDWVKTRDVFTRDETLVGSRCRSDENIKLNDFKDAANCLRALGYQKDDHQTRANGKRPYFWRKT